MGRVRDAWWWYGRDLRISVADPQGNLIFDANAVEAWLIATSGVQTIRGRMMDTIDLSIEPLKIQLTATRR